MSESSYTNGAPFLVTQVEPEAEFSANIKYLLPDGSRKKVTLMVADSTEEMHSAIGDALAAGKIGYGH